jgi:hypothetical protein
MDTSSDGISAPIPHSPSLITPLPALGDLPGAPIILSSDSDSPVPVAAWPLPQGVREAAPVSNLEAATPLPHGGVPAQPSPNPVTSSEASASVGVPIDSDGTPIDSVSSWGRDARHPLELSSEPSTHSSLRPSEVPDVPDMGPAR